ncbi:unnamed protein product [Trichobilharzia regenti]|nr:unnamed protein product [Trichobilharzia regenti]
MGPATADQRRSLHTEAVLAISPSSPTRIIARGDQQSDHQLGYAGQRQTDNTVHQQLWWPPPHHDVPGSCIDRDVCIQKGQVSQIPQAP